MGPLLKLLGKILLALVVIMAILAVAFVVFVGYQLSQSAEESREAVYMYDLSLSTTGPIENVSLLLPVPSRYNPATGRKETVLNLSLVSFSNFDRAGEIAVGIQEVDGIPMLHIAADRIDPIYRSHIEPIMILPGRNESELPPPPTYVYADHYSNATPELVAMELHLYDSDVDHEIDTREPLQSEALFLPYRITGDLGNVTGGMVDGIYVRNGASGYVVEVPFILSYDADEENVLSIATGLQGTNQWWVLGWRSNSYREQLSHAFTGPCNGTYPVTGVLTAGEGVY
ncbi:MAG: hypothetical protein APR53_04915 [Methanoculleus sp. SDB]|nr:MAG: hypothetical protein APR53_04915 [Methanoculleus sp. SDB]